MRLYSTIVGLLLLVSSILVCPASVTAFPSSDGHLSVVLLIDASGSMKTNDPQNLRIETARRMTQLLQDGDQLSVIQFGTGAQVLFPLQTVSEQARADAQKALARVGNDADTDIKAGLEAAFAQLEGSQATGQKFVMLLSDGKPDIPSLRSQWAMEQYLRQQDLLLVQYAERGWPVHCVALHQEDAGTALADIAAKTGGEYHFVKQASDLGNIFSAILLVQKYDENVKPELGVELPEKKSYKTGDQAIVTAWLGVGEDRLVVGPYLEITAFTCKLSYEDGSANSVEFFDDGRPEHGDVDEGDGVFSTVVYLHKPGRPKVDITFSGVYRDEPLSLSHQQELEIKGDPVVEDAGATEGGLSVPLPILAAAAAGVLFIGLVAIRVVKGTRKKQLLVQGYLRYWEGNGKATVGLASKLDMGNLRQEFVRVSSGADADYSLPLVQRQFGFSIRKMRSLVEVEGKKKSRKKQYLYEIQCEPGSVLVSQGRVKSREMVYDKDRFSIGGYTFELNDPGIGSRPGGHNVLSKYGKYIKVEKDEEESEQS